MLLVMAILVFRTSNKVSEMLGNVNTSNALSAFEKMEEKGETFRLSESSLNPCIAHFELKKKKITILVFSAFDLSSSQGH